MASGLGALVLVVFGALAAPIGQRFIDRVWPPSPSTPSTSTATSGPAESGAAPSPSVGRIVNPDLAVTNTGDLDDGATLVVTMHNTGTRRVVVTRVVVTVLEVAHFRICASQGDPIEISGSYDLTLPTTAIAGDTFEVPVRQQSGVDEADSFSVSVDLPTTEEFDGSTVFRLGVALVTDGDPTTVELGVATIALPGVPAVDSVEFWNPTQAQFAQDYYPADQADRIITCLHQGTATMRAILAEPGERSPDLAALATSLP